MNFLNVKKTVILLRFLTRHNHSPADLCKPALANVPINEEQGDPQGQLIKRGSEAGSSLTPRDEWGSGGKGGGGVMMGESALKNRMLAMEGG